MENPKCLLAHVNRLKKKKKKKIQLFSRKGPYGQSLDASPKKLLVSLIMLECKSAVCALLFPEKMVDLEIRMLLAC